MTLAPTEVASIVLAIALLISEVLPFIQDVRSNGITQGVCNCIRAPRTKLVMDTFVGKATLTPLQAVDILSPPVNVQSESTKIVVPPATPPVHKQNASNFKTPPIELTKTPTK